MLLANAFGQIDTLRHGRFYGGKGNRKTIGVVRSWIFSR